MRKLTDFILGGGVPKSLQVVTAAMKLKDTPWKKSHEQTRQHIQKQRITLPTMVHLVKAMVFPVVIYGCAAAADAKSLQSCLIL